MTLRRDHVAGGAFVVAGVLIVSVSGDLPFGTLASPGAGMLPTLVVILMMALGGTLVLRARESPPLAGTDWTDASHALRVILVAAVAVALYTTLGFLLTVPMLLFSLVFLAERRPILAAAAFALGMTTLAYLLFAYLLKTPLPRGPIDF
jgi:hypothetical protein